MTVDIANGGQELLGVRQSYVAGQIALDALQAAEMILSSRLGVTRNVEVLRPRLDVI